MTTSRRDFVKLSLLAGSSLAIGFRFDDAFAADSPANSTTPLQPNGWVRVDRDGSVTITVGKSEMGQGVRTSLPMILAEELDADWSSIRLEQASPDAQFTRLGTGGSFSVAGQWTPLRKAGATARAMLISAAAARLSVDAASLRTERGFVIHDASKQRLSYGELTEAAAALPIPADVPLKKTADFQIIGKATRRTDGRDIVSGKARYGIDVRVPGMRYATIVRPPTLGGSVKSFDATRAKKIKGIREVVKVTNGVAIVADNTWAALKARDVLDVVFEPGPHAAFSSALHAQKMREAATQSGFSTRKVVGEGAPAVVKRMEASYQYPFYAHATLETMNTVADVRGDKAEFWSPTQAPNDVHMRTATLLGIPPENVKVHVTLMGGGFGRRLGWDYALEAAEVSKAAGGGPVQLLWTRAEDMKNGYFQAASLHQMSAGFDADGKLVSWAHKKVSSPHNARRKPTAEQMQDPTFFRGNSWGVYDVPYDIPFIETSYVPVDTPVPIGPWRAVFSPSSTFARESFFDELAEAAKTDPIQFRLEHLAGEKFTAEDLTIERPRLRRVLEVLRAKSDWGKPMPKGSGRGMACNVYDGDTHVAYTAEVTVREGKVRVDRVVCVLDCGLIVNPAGIESQIEGGVIWSLSSALKSEITFKDGAAEQSSFGDFQVLRIDETPKIEIHLIPSHGETPFGVGEPTVPPMVPAVVNAIHAATGKRIRKLPIRPEDLA